tara:strand:- start:1558 stop:2160 length:603 start_codon:yes stop_codon:yes gene_type:complete
MKKLLGIVVLGLLLITPSQADDIRDFEIEGISLGDSLLNYFSKDEIDDFIDPYQDIVPNKKVKTFLTEDNLKQYDILELSFFKNDSDYKLESVGGGIFFPNNFNKCLDKQKEVSDELYLFFSKPEKNTSNFKYPADKSGKTKVFQHSFMIGDKKFYNVMINCFKFGKKFKNMGYVDNLNIIITTDKWSEYMASLGLSSEL